MKSRDEVSRVFRPRWRVYGGIALRGASLTLLLVSGTIWTIQQQHPRYARPAEMLKLPAAVIEATKPSEEAFRIGQVLRRYTRNEDVADRIASAVVSEGTRRKIDPALLVGVILVEADNLNPRATSFVGARGLMQVMPFHRGQWGCKSKDLYDIEGNICHGVSVLADNIKRSPSLRVALQRYNGCVRGSNTPDCHTYSRKVLSATDRTVRQISSVSLPPRTGE